VDADVPPALEAVCVKAMAREPRDRYATAADLAADVERFLADEPVTARREPAVERLARLARRHRGASLVAAVALAVLALGSVTAAVLVTGSKTREIRFRDIGEINRDLGDGWKVADFALWTPEHLASLDDRAGKLGTLNPAEGEEARRKTTEAFVAAAVRSNTLDDAARLRVEARLDDLDARAPGAASGLRERFRRHLGEWQLVPEPAPGPRPPDRPGLAVVPTSAPAGGRTRAEATFDAKWRLARAVGLALDYGDAGRYLFLLSVPEFEPDAEAGLFDLLPSLGASQRAHERIDLQILHGTRRLLRYPLGLPEGRLVLRATRVGGRLAVSVNGLPELAVEDPYPVRPGAAGAVGLVWPAAVGLERLRVERQLLPLPADPLGPGDEMLARGERLAKAGDFYRDRARELGDSAPGLEAVYKQAACLLDQTQAGEAEALWEGLASRLDARPVTGEVRWPALAACRVWLLHAGEPGPGPRKRLLARLGAVAPVRLAEVVPAGLRAEALDPLRDRVGLRHLRWLAAFRAPEELDWLRDAVEADRLLGEPGYERRMLTWRLADRYRLNGRADEALALVESLRTGPDLPEDERLAFERDRVWMLIESDRDGTGAALRAVDELLADPGLATLRHPLRLDRARALVAAGKRPEAERELDDFFADADRTGLEGTPQEYADFADACLLAGFLRAECDDPAAAAAAWERGLLRYWPGGLPPQYVLGVPSPLPLHLHTGATVAAIQLASLTGKLNPEETETLFRRLLTAPGAAAAFQFVSKRAPDLFSYVPAAFLGTARGPRGRDAARRMAYRQCSLTDYSVEPLQLSTFAAAKASAFPGAPDRLPGGLEDAYWDATCVLFTAYNRGRFEPKLLTDLLLLWEGHSPQPLTSWANLAPALAAVDRDGRLDLVGRAAYFFGNRYLVLKHERDASRFFEGVPPHSPLRPLAEAELARLKPAPPR
jgi:hypothetical protein